MASIQNETGAALIVALLLLLVLAILAPTAVNRLSQDFGRTTSYTESRDLFYLAEAGMEHGKSRIKAVRLNALLAGPDDLTGTVATDADNGLSFLINEVPPGSGTLVNTLVGTAFTWNGNVYNNVPFSGGNYYFRIYDNNDDADQTTDIDSLVYLESAGVNANGDVKILRALVYKYSFPPTTFPAAVTVTGPDPDLTGGGNAFTVKGGTGSGTTWGNGYDLVGAQDPTCPGKAALVFEDPGTLLTLGPGGGGNNECSHPSNAGIPCIKYGNNGHDNFRGYGYDDGPPGVPSHVTNSSVFTAADADDMWNRFLNPPDGSGSTADYTYLTTENDLVSGQVGTLDDPVVLHYTGDLSISGNLEGFGVLIVDGNLDIAGNPKWHGIVLVGASASTLAGKGNLTGSGNIKIYGAMTVGGGAAAFAGSAEIFYSCKGIEVANSANGGAFNVASWTEVD